jgi:uncharacterized membrane-anchored protein
MSEVIVHPTGNPILGVSWLDRAIAWLKHREKAALLIGAGFQIVLLVSLIVWRLIPLVTGDTVLLHVVPVDPRDMFRGDYVILSYEFSRMPPEGIQGLGAFSRSHSREWEGRTVYVTLVPEPDGRHWRAERFSINRPATGKFLRGTLTQWGGIEFGIESYFVQEGTGRQYEDAMRLRQLSAKVAVAPDGQAALTGLQIE